MCAEGSGEATLAADVGRAGVNAFVTVLDRQMALASTPVVLGLSILE